MFIEDKRIDETFSTRTISFESRDELAAMQRVCPHPLPATHVWEFRYEEPSEEALKRNRATLPKLILGPRELTLAEVREKSNDFEGLSTSELLWLQEKHKAKMPAFVKGEPKKSDAVAIREALIEYMKTNPTGAPKPAVKANRPEQVEPITLPEDIAKFSVEDIATEAAVKGWQEEYEGLKGRSLPVKRQWLASKRVEKLEPAGV